MFVGYIQQFISSLSKVVGLDNASLKVVICTLLSYPFNGLFKRLPDKKYTLKNAYILVVSTFYIFCILQLSTGLRTLLISSLGSYIITRYLKSKTMPWVNFVFLMGHLFHNHVYAQFFNDYDPTKVDILGAQMVMVMKLSAFGWSIHDARQPPESLSPYLKARVIKKHPNILPFLGYVFYFASLLTGPAFDYSEYDKFIHGTLFDDVPDSKRPGKRKRRIPRSLVPSLKKAMQGFFFAFLLIQSSKFVTLDYLLDGRLYAEHNFFYRAFFFWLLGFTFRLKYYAIWSMAEGACILGGIGYNGYNPETDSFKWNAVQNIDPLAFESGQNVHVCLEAWNMNTNRWLKNFIYIRVAKPGKRPGFKSTLFTFTTSAIWHGTRPGYYMVFVLGAFLQSLGKIYRRHIRPLFLDKDGKTAKPSKKYYDIVSYFATQLAFGFTVPPFVILDFKRSLYSWYVLYFYIPIVIAFTYVIFYGPWANQVFKWLRSHSDSYFEGQKKKGTRLSTEESAKVQNVINSITNRDDEVPALGIPSFEELQSVKEEDFQGYARELKEVWTSFIGRGSETGELGQAYQNFVAEVNEIYQSKSPESKNGASKVSRD